MMSSMFTHFNFNRAKFYLAPCAALILLVSASVTGCKQSSDALTNEPVLPAASSFGAMQNNLFATTCATSGCHDSRTKTAGMDLSTPDAAYQNLVNAVPTNANARLDGFVRVRPNKPDESLLLIKLDSSRLHRSDGYGSLMPLGSRGLASSQIEFVRQWILAGAPKNGLTIDTMMLVAPPSNETLTLAPPAEGVQLRVAPYTISPKRDREIFIAQPNTQDLAMTKFEMTQRDRSHHFILYGYDPSVPASQRPTVGTTRDLYDTLGRFNPEAYRGMNSRQFLAGAQTKSATVEFPEGMALRLPRQMLLDFNSHYSNGLAQPITGEVVFNIHTVAPARVRQWIKSLSLGNYAINLPPRLETTIEQTFLVGQGVVLGSNSFERDTLVRVVGLTSHAHQLMTKFVIQIVGGSRNGEIVYSATNWQNPPIIFFREPIVLRRGEGLKSVCTWNNTTDQTVTFGYTTSDEMHLVYGYYY
jgi:hypothetical protein